MVAGIVYPQDLSLRTWPASLPNPLIDIGDDRVRLSAMMFLEYFIAPHPNYSAAEALQTSAIVLP